MHKKYVILTKSQHKQYNLEKDSKDTATDPKESWLFILINEIKEFKNEFKKLFGKFIFF